MRVDRQEDGSVLIALSQEEARLLKRAIGLAGPKEQTTFGYECWHRVTGVLQTLGVHLAIALRETLHRF